MRIVCGGDYRCAQYKPFVLTYADQWVPRTTIMALYPDFPRSPYEILPPEQRWFPAAEEMRSTAYEKLLPPLVANIRREIAQWRDDHYAGASATSRALLNWWFKTEHMTEEADGSLSPFRYYFAQREAVETVIWLHDVRKVRDKFDLLRFDASGSVSANMFDEQWPRYVIKMATGAGKTKVLSLLIAWSYFHKLYEPDSTLARNFLVIAPNIIVLIAFVPTSTDRGSSSTIRSFRQRARWPKLAGRFSDHVAHSGRCPCCARYRQYLPDQYSSCLSRRRA